MADDEDGVATRDGKRAGWARWIGEGSAKQSRRKELMSSGDRKDVKQIITLRKRVFGQEGRTHRLTGAARGRRDTGLSQEKAIPFKHP